MKAKKKRAPKSRSKISVGADRPKPQSSYWWPYFEAADRRDFRTGWFYFPKLAPTEQMDYMTVRAIVERSDFLYGNCAPFKMAVDGLALDEVGLGLWPTWQTSKPDFNKEVTDAFHNSNSDPRIFSLDGRTDFYSSQLQIRVMIRRYGDCFGQLIRAGVGSGYGSNSPGVHLIPGYLCENAGTEDQKSGWIRGILPDKFNRATKYRFLKTDSGGPFLHNEEIGYTDEDPENVLHFHDPMVAGQLRGMPVATSIAKKMFRFEDVKRAMSNGTLSREMLGFAIEVDNDTGPGPSIILPGARAIEQETVSQATATSATGTSEKPAASKFTVQQFFGPDQQERVVVPELRGGAKFKMLESGRPGTAVMEFLDSILRELAWAADYPPEYVFFIASGRQGTQLRLLLQKVNNIINAKREFQLKPQFLYRWPVFWVWNAMIKTNRVQAVVPDDWWKFKIGGTRDMTVDIGREGRLYDERVSTNKMSISTYHALYGEDDSEVEDENLAVIERRIGKLDALNKKLGTSFTYYDIWPRTAGSAGSDVATGAQAPDPNTGQPAASAGNPAPAAGGGNGRNRLARV